MSMSVRCDGCGLEYAGARGRRRAVRPARQRCCAAATCGCSPRCRASTGRPATALASGRADGRDARRLPAPRAASRRYFVAHFVTPLVSAVWSCAAADRAALPGRATCSASSTTTGCCRSPARRSGARSPAARAEYVERIAQAPDRGAHRHPGPRGAPARRRASGSPPTTARRREFDAVVIATHPDQALRMLADPTDGRAARCSAPSRTRATRPCCTPTPRCCRRAAAPAPRGTTCCPRATPPPDGCRSATT